MKIVELTGEVIELKVLSLESFNGIDHFSARSVGRVQHLSGSIHVGGIFVSPSAEVTQSTNGEYTLYLSQEEDDA